MINGRCAEQQHQLVGGRSVIRGVCIIIDSRYFDFHRVDTKLVIIWFRGRGWDWWNESRESIPIIFLTSYAVHSGTWSNVWFGGDEIRMEFTKRIKAWTWRREIRINVVSWWNSIGHNRTEERIKVSEALCVCTVASMYIYAQTAVILTLSLNCMANHAASYCN